MRAGQLDKRVTIARRDPAAGRDAYGKPIPGTVAIATVWANVADVTARDRVAAPQVMGVRSARVTIRWRAGVESDHVLLFDGRVWAIRGIANLGRREWIQLTVEAVEVRT